MLLAFSFGFLRFSTVPDVYPLVTFFALLAYIATLRALDAPDLVPGRAAFAGVVAALPILFYKPAAVIVVPLAVAALVRRRPVAARLAFLAAMATVATAGPVLAAALRGDPSTFWAFVTETKDNVVFGLHPSYLPRGLMSFGSDVIAMGWVFGHPAVVNALRTVFPDKVVVEEVFAASRAGWLTSVPLVTLPILGVTALGMGAAALRARRIPRVTSDVACLAGWGLLFGGALMVFDPSSVEPWTLVLPPLFLLGTRYLLEPAARVVPGWIVPVMLAAFIAHNTLAGIGIVFSAEGDYCAVLAAPAARDARPGDLLITTNRKLAVYVRNETNLDATNVAFAGPPTDVEVQDRLSRGSRVFISDDVAEPSPAVVRRYAARIPEVTEFWQRQRDRARVFAETPAGRLYVLEPPRKGS